MDKLSTAKRSELMSRIKCRDTTPEIIVRKITYSMGYRYRLHGNDLPGKPDLVFRSRRKAMFVHGCFWHQHEGCKDSHIPKSNLRYWEPKLKRTKKRDAMNQEKLISAGWGVLVIWSCMLNDLEQSRNRIRNFLET